MKSYSRSHLSDQVLVRNLAAQVARESSGTAELLADLAEVDARKLYLPAAHPSMFSYCVYELHLSEDSAFKRIRAARTARQFPVFFTAVAEGRLHLSGVVLLTPHLTPENAHELLAAAAHKTKAQIEQILAERFPQPEVPTRVEAIAPPPSPDPQLAPGPVETPTQPHPRGRVGEQLAPGPVESRASRSKVASVAPQRFALQLTMSQSLHDKLRYAQELLSHQIPFGDVAEVLERALDLLIRDLEKRKFGATAKPRPARRPKTTHGRYVPAHVKSAVWERDQGQCTFVSATGHRCPARKFLEFDHVDEVARGGRATVARMRLRCRAHNQYEAERTFGTEFMRHKREQAQRVAAAARAKAAAEQDPEISVIPWLRRLGFRADEARRAAARCENMPDASLEERVRVALSSLAPSHRRTTNHLGTAA